jgi:flagellar hook capping protein FlgD/cohesin domain-containing protein
MKLKRLLSLAGVIALLLMVAGSRLNAANAIDVQDGAEGFSGATTEVNVYLTTDSSFSGIEITLAYDSAKLSYVAGSIDVNSQVWAGDAPDVDTTTAGQLNLKFYTLADEENLAQLTTSKRFFTVTMDIAEGLIPGDEAITVSEAEIAGVDDAYLPVYYPITGSNLQAGYVDILSKFILSIDSVDASLDYPFEVPVYLINAEEAQAVEFILNYTTSQLDYEHSIEVNTDIWQDGEPVVDVDSSVAGQLRIGVYSLEGATIQTSVAAQWIAKLTFKTAEDAIPGPSNPLEISDAIVTTFSTDLLPVYNPPSPVDGNVNILGKYSLRVSRDATAVPGGADTVKVYLKNSEDIAGYEITLTFDQNNFTVAESDVNLIETVYDDPSEFQAKIDPDDGSVIVGAGALSDAVIPASSEEKLIFEVILNVEEDATYGVDSDSIYAAGEVTVMVDYLPQYIDISPADITNGAFFIRGEFEFTVVDVTGSLESTQTVTIQISNKDEINALAMYLRFDSDELEVVDGSVVVNEDLWTDGAPQDAEFTYYADSVKIGLVDLSGSNNIVAGNTAQTLLTVQLTAAYALGDGDTASISVDGEATIIGDDFLPSYMTVAPAVGYFAVVSGDAAPPDTVTNIVVVEGEAQLELSWVNPPADDLGLVTVVRVASGTGVIDTIYNSVQYGSLLDSWTDEDLDPTEEYYYSFQTWDLTGNTLVAISRGPYTPQAIVITDAVLEITDVITVAEDVVPLQVLMTSAVDVAGVGFEVSFDQTKLQIESAALGEDAGGLNTVIPVEIDSANVNGVLSVNLADLTLVSPVAAGSDLEIYIVTFKAPADATEGDVIPVTLSGVSISDTAAVSISVKTVNGSVTIQGDEYVDPTGDGKTDVQDLYYYVANPGLMTIGQVATIIRKMLKKALPATLLAAAQDATSSWSAEGAALVRLDSNFEMIAARFTFSYDNAFTVADIQLNRSLPNSAMIIPFYQDGNLVVDVLNMGSGLVPAQLEGALFQVLFEGATYQEARLKLEQVEVVDIDGEVYGSELAAILGDAVVLPKAYSLSQNSPNPFNPSTTISYELPEAAGAIKVVLDVYNIRGQRVVTLVDELKDAGKYTVNWDGRDASGRAVSSGVYFYRMQAGEFSSVRKMVILK